MTINHTECPGTTPRSSHLVSRHTTLSTRHHGIWDPRSCRRVYSWSAPWSLCTSPAIATSFSARPSLSRLRWCTHMDRLGCWRGMARPWRHTLWAQLAAVRTSQQRFSEREGRWWNCAVIVRFPRSPAVGTIRHDHHRQLDRSKNVLSIINKSVTVNSSTITCQPS